MLPLKPAPTSAKTVGLVLIPIALIILTIIAISSSFVLYRYFKTRRLRKQEDIERVIKEASAAIGPLH
ncbi:hypothetical protein EJ06DRAFT_527516 [Trichodelitschia bisporula]|uniref:Uncharacterized protein n=1 Tax=Trichodelitschia bisporula TaxID=703511 RepID=A0A6G1I7A7_9PEZI|nr:hypothetical protein EJ06DRAFT_527516 [Trichodelitschia bisporula]